MLSHPSVVIRQRNLFLSILAAISAYLMIVPLVLADFSLWQFQQLYFGIYRIPKINRKKYFCFDRHLLSQLTIVQKINCAYCTYANGVIHFASAVAAQMERYSCAVKHTKNVPGHQHQADFIEYAQLK